MVLSNKALSQILEGNGAKPAQALVHKSDVRRDLNAKRLKINEYHADGSQALFEEEDGRWRKLSSVSSITGENRAMEAVESNSMEWRMVNILVAASIVAIIRRLTRASAASSRLSSLKCRRLAGAMSRAASGISIRTTSKRAASAWWRARGIGGRRQMRAAKGAKCGAGGGSAGIGSGDHPI